MKAPARFIVPRQVCAISAWLLKCKNNLPEKRRHLKETPKINTISSAILKTVRQYGRRLKQLKASVPVIGQKSVRQDKPSFLISLDVIRPLQQPSSKMIRADLAVRHTHIFRGNFHNSKIFASGARHSHVTRRNLYPYPYIGRSLWKK